MSAEAPPPRGDQSEFTGVNPSDFRAPLPYEEAAAVAAAPPVEAQQIPVQEVESDEVPLAVAPEAAVTPAEPAPEPSAETAPVTAPEAAAEPEPAPEPIPSPDAAEDAQEATAEAEEEPSNEEPPTELSPDNRALFSRMSEKGRGLARRVYNGLLHTPGAERVVGKLQIAYNQFWLDRNQRKAVELKGQTDQLQIRVDALDMSKTEIESVIEGLKQQNQPGVEALQLKVQDIERRKSELMNQKDSKQSSFEAVDNQVNLFTQERDAVADRLIKSYDEQLKPIEEELASLQTSRDETNLVIEVALAKHEEQQAKLEAIETKKAQIEEALRQSGMSEKEIRRFGAIKELDAVVADGRKRMSDELEELSARRTEINSKVADLDARANPYRDKREEFIRLKQNRPIEINVPTRQKQENPDFALETKANTRILSEASGGASASETLIVGTPETATIDQRPSVAEYINQWNSLLADKYGDDAQSVDLRDFLAATKLPESYQLGTDRFKSILGSYVKLRKLSLDQFNKSKNELPS